MKSIMLTGIRQMEIFEVPEPVLKNPGDVKIKMSVVGVCGSDIHYYTTGRIGSQIVKYPFPVGHEGAGVVVEVGKSVTSVKPGDAIAIEPSMFCGKCDQCLSGRPNTCRNIKFLGVPEQADGCMSEYIIMPEKSCLPLLNGLTADAGALSEPLTIGLYSVRTSIPIKAKTVGILGFGPIGMSVMLTARAEGAGNIYVTDKIDKRLAVASKEGISLALNPLKADIVKRIMEAEPLGLDVVFECCGQQEAFNQGIEMLKPGGKLMIVGIPEFDTWMMSAEKTRRNELVIQSVRRQAHCTEDILRMMASGKINYSTMVTHRFPMSKAQEAFDLVAAYGDGVMKAMIDF